MWYMVLIVEYFVVVDEQGAVGYSCGD